MKKVLVTGASGFIGAHTLPRLLEAGFEVHAVSSNCAAPFSAPVHPHAADLLSPADRRNLVRLVRPTHILHLAWYVPTGKYWTAPENVQWLNASLDLLQEFAAAGGRRWVSAGTCAEYDWSANHPLAETDACRPATLYGASKHAFALVAGQMARVTGVRAATGRIFYPYGPGESRSRLIASVICSLLAGEPARCTEGRQMRDFIFVEDVASAFIALLDNDHEGPVNFGSGIPVAVRDVVLRIGEMLGRPDLLRLGAIPTPAGEAPFVVADTTVLHSLGIHCRDNLTSGLARTIEWWSSRSTEFRKT